MERTCIITVKHFLIKLFFFPPNSYNSLLCKSAFLKKKITNLLGILIFIIGFDWKTLFFLFRNSLGFHYIHILFPLFEKQRERGVQVPFQELKILIITYVSGIFSCIIGASVHPFIYVFPCFILFPLSSLCLAFRARASVAIGNHN